jgi:site-specific DNA-methyltransferase (adenine-specific)
MTVKLIQGDCLEEMKKLIDDGVKVDLIVTDPPYLMNYKTGYRKDKSHDFCKPIINDNNFDLIKDVMPLLFELLKEGGAVYMFCNANHIDYFKQQIEQHFKLKNILIWIKNNWSVGDLKGAYAKQTEFILFASKGRHLLNGARDTDTLYYNRVVGNMQLHQNQKPVDLLKFLIGKSSQPNDIILDCFMGSGSTAIACKNTNRQFIGIELDKDYYQIAQERCKNYQTKLEV